MDERKGKEDLLKAITEGVVEVEKLMGEIRDRFLEVVNMLRVKQDEEAFYRLSGGMENLKDLMAFLNQLREGLESLDNPSIPQKELQCWERSTGLFKEMLSAFEQKDWITVADLIEYELVPILEKGREELKELGKLLKV